MPEYTPPSSESEFQENFAQINPLMNETQAYYESSRCLFCYDAPCINACPTGIDIPLFIRQINSGNTLGAAKTIYEQNYFGFSCGKVCPTEVLCEGACVYNHQDVKPIEIGRLQSFATNKAIKEDKQLFQTGKQNGFRVAIIGAGPAGISCACELRMYGYEVDIYEAKSHPSGLTLYGVAPYKITNEQALAEMAYLEKQFGFRVFYNKSIETEYDLSDLEDKYDAIFLGIGLGRTRELQIPGEELSESWGAVEFIEQLRIEQHKVSPAKEVVVLGGGNTAMDAASESARLGAESVVLAYRREKDSMGAYDFEYELAKGAGVKGVFGITPIKILGTTHVEGVEFLRTTTQNGKLETIPDSEFTIPCDRVIRATGQQKQTDFLEKIEGMKWDNRGKIMIDPLTYQTAHPKYFAAGDAVNGGAEVVNAVAEAKIAAKGIHDYLFLGD